MGLGHIVWRYNSGSGCNNPNIYYYDGYGVVEITFQDASNQALYLNDLGHLVWTRYDYCDGPSVSDTMLHSDGTTQYVTVDDLWPQNPFINNLGQIVWHENHGDENRRVRFWAEGLPAPTTLAEFGSGPKINDLGAVVYSWPPADGESGQVWLIPDVPASPGPPIQVTYGPDMNGAQDINNAGEVSILAGNLPLLTSVRLLRRIRNGDVDFDRDVDSDDFATLPGCLTGPVATDRLCDCRFFDMDHDRDVDLADFALFQNALGQTNLP